MRPRRVPGIIVAAVCLLFLSLAAFSPVLVRGRQFAYRDSGNFYYPLYLRIQ